MCCELLAENTSRAVGFNTDCGHCISDPDTPANTEQQKSSFVMTGEQSIVIKASCVSEHLTLHICPSAAKHALTVAVMWALMVTSDEFTHNHTAILGN